jgi:translation initiation factor RLI1
MHSALRELMLHDMRLYELRNEKTARYARDFLKHFKLPIRLLTRGKVLELGGNNSTPITVALRLLREKNIKPVRRLKWTPPDLMHDDYKLETNRGNK